MQEVITITKNKVGRPKTETAMNKRITVRLDSKHEEILETYTKKYGITKNEAVRKGIEKLEEKE
ncbi:TPA: hypothetical protein ACG3KG_003698 [Clostridioides difficile]|uniref:hypothetical protein n=1 Tax=Clostridioides difficile TaxID=1496 RepID=UPI000BD37DD1|nr:hypothetical protein [Clostridioides difficile]EKG0822641.1 hypothetical protein [Clostridioides difficile]EKJ1267220.1 hypothetical protein [Clostridioides difficile]MDN4810323.1 hypothetical protein [Clostridioides difficile]PBD74606.1 hypothetical protein BGU03_19500 [Clostridioides difficile]HBF2158181.1 hypothetical protein [Clostridioides difficile]